jgi:hypothetical protein
MALPQVSVLRCPRGITEEVVVLKQEPSYFESARLFWFEEIFDDLDFYKVAIVSPPESPKFILRRYRNSPSPGVVMLVEKGGPDEMRRSVQQALDLLGLDKNSVTWVRDDLGSI